MNIVSTSKLKNTEQAKEQFEPLKKNLEESIVMAILNISDTIVKHGDIVCQRMGITTQQWRVMLHLACDPNIPFIDEMTSNKHPILASELAEAFNVSRPNITNLINSLIEKGMVKQIEDAKDRRKKFLTLTEKGEDVLQAIQPFRKKANKRLLEHLEKDEKEHFYEKLMDCLSVLNNDFSLKK
jgi:DNA-binding MarR family transcriptional regulator